MTSFYFPDFVATRFFSSSDNGFFPTCWLYQTAHHKQWLSPASQSVTFSESPSSFWSLLSNILSSVRLLANCKFFQPSLIRSTTALSNSIIVGPRFTGPSNPVFPSLAPKSIQPHTTQVSFFNLPIPSIWTWALLPSSNEDGLAPLSPMSTW